MKTENWSTVNIQNLTGKTIIVTGGNSGLGYESVKAFAEKGADVILASRSIEKGENAKNEIIKSGIKGTITVMKLDLSDLSSVKNFATEFNQKYTKLDVLLNNAGIMTTPYHLTKDGFEGQSGTNHLGHFALTALLTDKIKNTQKSRVVNVASTAHKMGKMDFSNPLFENGKGYSPMKAYGRSKLSNLLFTYELQRYFEKNNIDSIAVAAHPGFAATNLGRYLEKKFLFKILMPLANLIAQNQFMGALPQIRASVDLEVKGAQYYGPNKGMKGFPVIVKSNSDSYNVDDAKKLWEMSEKLTGIKFS